MSSKNVLYILMLSVVLVLAWQVYVYGCGDTPVAFVEFATTDESDLDRPNGPEDYYHFTSTPHVHCVRVGNKGLGLGMNASSLADYLHSSHPGYCADWFETEEERSCDNDSSYTRLLDWQDGIKFWNWSFGDGSSWYEFLEAWNHSSDGCGCGEGVDCEYNLNGHHRHQYANPGYYNGYLVVTDDDAYEGLGPDKAGFTTFNVLAFDMEINSNKSTIAVGELLPVTLSFSPGTCTTGQTALELSEFRSWYIDGVKVWADSDRTTELLPGGSAVWDPPPSMPETVWVEATEAGEFGLELSYQINDGADTVSMDRLEIEAVMPEVEVDRIQYYDPDMGYTDVIGTLYVCEGTSVTFKAITDPAGASWPSGEPVWGGTSGASGTGTTTVVTFTGESSSSTDYQTVTAECGNTITVNVIVYNFYGTVSFKHFAGRSDVRLGVYEKAVCHSGVYTTGVTVEEIGGLLWDKTGSGTLSRVHATSGAAMYQAGEYAGSATFKLTIASGPSKGVFIEDWPTTIVEPSGGVCERREGSNIWHVQNTFSIGVNTYMYLRPTDVSFEWIGFSEGYCASELGGTWFHHQFIGTYHSAWGNWEDVGEGDSDYGCRILQPNGDFAELWDYSPYLPYEFGTLAWGIPWKYKAGEEEKTFTTMNQVFKVGPTGKAEVIKDSSGWFENFHSWGDRPYWWP